MANKSVNIKINANSKNAVGNINKLKKELNSLSKSIDNNKWVSLSKAFNNVASSVSFLGKAFKLAKDAIVDMHNASLQQISAEKSLEIAGKNNPYLNHQNIVALKQYASELQSIGTVGDETLLPLMAQLAAAGRSQEEIQNIMSVALDVSASGAMSLDSAVKNLNKTYSGLAGELGESIPAIKNLTKEQLQNGEAVKILGQSYSGMSKELAESTGKAQQFANSWGDFKEEVGMFFVGLTKPVQEFFGAIVSGWASAMQSTRLARDVLYSGEIGSNFIEDFEKTAGSQEKAFKLAKKTLSLYSIALEEAGNDANKVRDVLQKIAENADLTVEKIILLNDKYNIFGDTTNKVINLIKQEQFAIAEKERLEKAEEERLKRVANLTTNYKNSINAKREEIAMREKNGEKITHEEKAQELLNKATEEYNNTRKLAGQDVTDADPWVIETKKQIEQLNKDIKTAREKDNNEKVLAIQAQYDASIESAKKSIAYRKSAGQVITEEQEAQELLNAKINAYVKARTNAGSLISDTNTWAVKTTEDIKTLATEIENLPQAMENAENSLQGFKSLTEEERLALGEELTNQIYDEWNNTLEVQREALIEYGALLKETFGENSKEYEAYKEALKKIDDEIAENAKASSKDRLQSLSKQLSSAKEFITTFSDITSTATALAQKKNEAETASELKDLQEQYDAGLISYEEYQNQKEKIEKESAEKQYKLDMWNWGASMAESAINTALACTKALADGGPFAGPVLATMMGTLGALQLATIVASKPQPPSFATGGIVQGNSYTGDKVKANVNSGEMILNARQQRQLWESANGATSSRSTNVIINNSASNIVKAQPKISERQIEILIDTRVNESMKKGKYNSSMNVAQSKQSGIFYGV